MTPPPPPKKSKVERIIKGVRSGVDRLQAVILPGSPERSTPSRTSGPIGNANSPALYPIPNRLTTQPPPLEGLPKTGQITEPQHSSAGAAPTPASLASPAPISVNKPSEAWTVTRSGLETTVRLLERSMDVFPPLKSALGGLVGCLDLIHAAASNREDYEQLTSEFKTMEETLTRYASDLNSAGHSSSAARILRSIETEVAHIVKQQAHGTPRRIVESPRDTGYVINHYRTIQSLVRQLQIDLALRTWDSTRKLDQRTLLQGLSPVNDALYNSSYSTTIKRRGCTAETRQMIQAELQDWAGDPNGSKVYWMNGMAGTGKTTIMYSLCEWLEANRQLGANFCCSRLSSSCRNVNDIIPTLAYQLAQYSPAFRSALCKALEVEPDTNKRNIVLQFTKLVQEPMQKVKDAIPDGVVVVIDALDECEDNYGVRLILETVLKLVSNLPIKFFVTSRPEPMIRDKMVAQGGYTLSILRLHEIERCTVEEDIKKYLTDALGSMSPLPSSDEIGRLAKHAGNLFIYAATAAQYIHPDNMHVDSCTRLQTMLKRESALDGACMSTKQYEELDGLYTSILSAAFSPKLEDEERVAMKIILQTVICVKEPMTVETLAMLLNLTKEKVKIALEPLHSVLHVPEGGGPVSALHASFPDYMFDKHRAKGFYCDNGQHSEFLVHCCFDVMKVQLCFNICSLESSFVFDKDIDDLAGRINGSISSALSYSCQYWGEHLHRGDRTEALHLKLIDFLTYRLLFWMEVLNLEQHIASAAKILHQAQNWITRHSLIEIRKEAADAEAFVRWFTGGACTYSTPHIYISALPFCPKSSSVYKNYWKQTQGLISVKGTAMTQWETAALAMWITDNNVFSVAFSSDGAHIASGSSDGTIQIWDLCTGEAVTGPFKGHTDSVTSVTFSPNGTCIASGSNDGTIRVWDSCTGEVVAGPFKGHKNWVTTVAFSPDGTCIASGSHDHTIRVWDAQTGEAITSSFEGHTGWVRSVAFSPDGTCIASGSNDRTIRVWDSHSGKAVAGPFEGCTDWVTSVAFSPDGTCIVSGSNDCIQVWNACTGEIVAGPFGGHKDWIRSVAFSPDGNCIVSGAHDYTIHVWDSHTGKAVAGPFEGHTGWVTSVAFSPDGTCIASGSNDHTIRIWDSQTSKISTSPFKGHTDWILSVAFSPNGTCIASGSKDHTIQVWNLYTGEVVAGPFEGHTGWVRSVVFSPDGTCIASGSHDGTIRVWDSHTTEPIGCAFEGHTDWITSVAFSSDGTCIASGSHDSTIRVWDIYTSKAIAGPFEGHTRWIISIAFSPDGTCIASGSHDHTIRVWHSHTGETVAGPFEGHTGSVTSVTFSPNGDYIASGSHDHTIRVWDSHTGAAVVGPFEGHTGFVTSVIFSPNGAYIASGSTDNTVRVWDSHTGETIAGPFEGHTDWVRSVTFSPCGTFIASGSHDCTIQVWDLHANEVIPSSFNRYTDGIRSSATSEPFKEHTLCNTVNSLVVAHPNKPHTILSDASTISSLNLKHAFPAITNFTFNTDGWITGDSIPLFWVAPYFHSLLPHPSSMLRIGPKGSLFIDYQSLMIGKKWSQCYIF